MNSISEDNVSRILINPYHAINFYEYDYDATKTKEDWILANTHLIEDLGAQSWLTMLLIVMAYERKGEPDETINPFSAVKPSDRLRGKHTTTVDPVQWVMANIKLMKELGTKEWLGKLLEVIETGV